MTAQHFFVCSGAVSCQDNFRAQSSLACKTEQMTVKQTISQSENNTNTVSIRVMQIGRAILSSCKSMGLRSRSGSLPTLPLTCCETLGKPLNHFVPQFPYSALGIVTLLLVLLAAKKAGFKYLGVSSESFRLLA